MDAGLVKKIDLFLNSHDGLRGVPATSDEISLAENNLGIKFNSQYVDFIKKFGGSYGGIGIHAFKNGRLIGRETVVELTKWFRESNPYFDKDNSLMERSYVISGDGGGNDIFMTEDGRIYLLDNDSGEIEMRANSLDELLQKTFG